MDERGMSCESPEAGVLSDSGFRELRRHYRENPIALYVGAGASWASTSEKASGEEPKYGVSGWEGLLRAILRASPRAGARRLQEFEVNVTTRYRNRPWEIADWVAARVGKEEFQRQVVALVQRLDNFPESRQARPGDGRDSTSGKKYKQLGGRFLDAAPTLNAVCAFCAQLTAVVQDAAANTYRVSPNPRVRAVVTTNYDPFLEAASSTMFIRNRLKPVGARGSSVGSLHQIPVFHVHGYVPYPERGRSRRRRAIVPMVDPVVTTSDYKKAWRQDKAYCFTMGPQVHVLRHYCTLFVGFSFRDAWVNRLLRRLKKEREEHDRPFWHYALMKKSEIEAKGPVFFHDLGVKPIALDRYCQIPECLGRLYVEGLKADHGPDDILLPLVPKTRARKAADTQNPGPAGATPVKARYNPGGDERARLSPERYWQDLLTCRNCYVKQDATGHRVFSRSDVDHESSR